MELLYELGSLVPPILTGLAFWFVMRALLRADRREREAERAAEREWEQRHESGGGVGPRD
ncbi:hypothetical protein [Brachybacterium nesterenkovii]|uniref:Uncharacterized protein n=1 Tax=Brachybacterium nesterenkovii TaxID=47847 RepID=A0A1X6X0X3_9MICO|nr:hypothetical protein [Brachybacterium nesterenkovii]SLM92046.1 hypothetical protein FM110_07515 [Brachybacterium nesterenkovii]